MEKERGGKTPGEEGRRGRKRRKKEGKGEQEGRAGRKRWKEEVVGEDGVTKRCGGEGLETHLYIKIILKYRGQTQLIKIGDYFKTFYHRFHPLRVHLFIWCCT